MRYPGHSLIPWLLVRCAFILSLHCLSRWPHECKYSFNCLILILYLQPNLFINLQTHISNHPLDICTQGPHRHLNRAKRSSWVFFPDLFLLYNITTCSTTHTNTCKSSWHPPLPSSLHLFQKQTLLIPSPSTSGINPPSNSTVTTPIQATIASCLKDSKPLTHWSPSSTLTPFNSFYIQQQKWVQKN